MRTKFITATFLCFAVLSMLFFSCTKDMENLEVVEQKVEFQSISPSSDIHIPDRIFRSCVLKQLGRTDGPITRAEVLSITDLRLQGSIPFRTYIMSLEGIEHFKNLEKLTIRDFKPEEKTIIGMMFIESCYLEGFPRLRELVYDSNFCDSLNVSDCPALEAIYCTNSQITDLNFQNCPNLIKLDCSRNMLLDINENLRGAPKLKWLDCSNNSLGNGMGAEIYTLKVYHLKELKYLDCVNNAMRHIGIFRGQTFDYLNIDAHTIKRIY